MVVFKKSMGEKCPSIFTVLNQAMSNAIEKVTTPITNIIDSV